MKSARALALLGGLSAAEFMRLHWQKKPLLVRGALPGAWSQIDRRRLFALAARDDVESRLIRNEGARWSVRNGPLPRRALPAVAKPGWTLLVQGVDLHDDAAHELLQRFRFIADARLDDAMFSFASDGGGVGPHVDSYDVFLLQTEGRRRWRVGPVGRARLRQDVPLKMLAGFKARDEWLLEAGDMLYLPPGWAHEGIADGPCITCSIGFRAPAADALAADVLQRVAEAAQEKVDAAVAGKVYRDADALPTASPSRIPASLQRFADAAVSAALRDCAARRRALGEVLSEPKPGTWFGRDEGASVDAAVVLDRRTRMLYDEDHVFINGESFRAAGRDAKLLHRLADARRLDAGDVRRLGPEAQALLARWTEDGWCSNREDPS